ncbi:MAG: sensor histidine kinase [Lentilactobacillus diolivorans]|jgi:signal transduction histidine kinase|nr:sensor histidine kinase [Lentilactobacillus diolivorans]RRG03610.1 MAG: sensor histidine kinase [Lactobacillus sp.]
MKNKPRLIFRIIVSEWGILVAYLLFIFLFYFICVLYKVDLDVVGDLVRYTLAPFLIVVGFRVYQKVIDVKAINILVKDGNFQQFQLHGFYGRLYSQALKKLMKQQLTETRDLQESLKNREDYLTLWSHEMKTPLTSLLMIAENNATVPSEEVSEKIELVNYQLKQLLTFDRLDDFNNDLDFKKIDLVECIKKVIQQNASFFLSHHVMPDIHVPTVNALSDSKWLSFILEQIITNAVKYSDKNSTVQIEYNNNVLKISDQGIGIAKSDLPRIFDQGFTGSNGRTHGEATGMGLYMARRVAKILDIKIDISSTENVGTTVKLIFNPKKITTK